MVKRLAFHAASIFVLWFDAKAVLDGRIQAGPDGHSPLHRSSGFLARWSARSENRRDTRKAEYGCPVAARRRTELKSDRLDRLARLARRREPGHLEASALAVL